MPLACKFCIATRGLKGSEISSLPQTQEELVEHIERVHGIAVRREGESAEHAETRMREMHGPTWPEMFR